MFLVWFLSSLVPEPEGLKIQYSQPKLWCLLCSVFLCIGSPTRAHALRYFPNCTPEIELQYYNTKKSAFPFPHEYLLFCTTYQQPHGSTTYVKYVRVHSHAQASTPISDVTATPCNKYICVASVQLYGFGIALVGVWVRACSQACKAGSRATRNL